MNITLISHMHRNSILFDSEGYLASRRVEVSFNHAAALTLRWASATGQFAICRKLVTDS